MKAGTDILVIKHNRPKTLEKVKINLKEKEKIWCEHHTTFLILLNGAYLGVLL
jgi:hypothetical protein